VRSALLAGPGSRLAPARSAGIAVALLATSATAAGADTLVTAAPGARNLAANGGLHYAPSFR
jgi:hypothetical protein